MATYLFDFDGTLVDSMPTYCAMVKKVLEDEHIPYGPDQIKAAADRYITCFSEFFAESEETI